MVFKKREGSLQCNTWLAELPSLRAWRPRRCDALGAVRRAGRILGGRGKGASGAAATWPGPLRPRPLLLRAVIHSLLRPGAPFPARRRARRLGVYRPRTHEQASRFSAPLGTPVHAMADSERLSAPGCWAACTNFSRTRKGILLFAEIVSALGLAGGQRRGRVAGLRGVGQLRGRQARGPGLLAVERGVRGLVAQARNQGRTQGESVKFGEGGRELLAHGVRQEAHRGIWGAPWRETP